MWPRAACSIYSDLTVERPPPKGRWNYTCTVHTDTLIRACYYDRDTAACLFVCLYFLFTKRTHIRSLTTGIGFPILHVCFVPSCRPHSRQIIVALIKHVLELKIVYFYKEKKNKDQIAL